jgi:uncharacterized glyoxalase superfamily protein PhnB
LRTLARHHQRAIPYLYYRDPREAIAFLQEAFGLTLHVMHEDPDEGILHAQLGFADGGVMLGPARREYEFASPAELPARHGAVWCYVEDVDAHHVQARAAGATILRGPADQPYGVREYDARDLEGHEWFFVSTLEAEDEPPPPRKSAAVRRGSRKPASRKPGSRKSASSRSTSKTAGRPARKRPRGGKGTRGR